MIVEYRNHDGARFRVWTPEDANYGSFHIVTRSELQIIIRACTLLGVVCRPADDAHIDPLSMEGFPLHCPSLSEQQLRNEAIASS